MNSMMCLVRDTVHVYMLGLTSPGELSHGIIAIGGLILPQK